MLRTGENILFFKYLFVIISIPEDIAKGSPPLNAILLILVISDITFLGILKISNPSLILLFTTIASSSLVRFLFFPNSFLFSRILSNITIVLLIE